MQGPFTKPEPLKALVLCSSGLDSVYNLLLAKKKYDKVCVLFFDYGQKAAPHEYVRVKKLSSILSLELMRIDLPWYRGLSSTLLDYSRKITEYKDKIQADKDKKINEWVPNRNGVFVNIAAAVAESEHYDVIVIGVNKEEALRYPDNSVKFLQGSEELLKLSTLSHPKLHSFSAELDKKNILKDLHPLMKEYNLPIQLVWSCYESFEKMCGTCESCVRLKGALKDNGMESEWKGLFLK